MKENTFLNNVKTKASTLGMTALLTLNSVSLAFAEQLEEMLLTQLMKQLIRLMILQVCCVPYFRG